MVIDELGLAKLAETFMCHLLDRPIEPRLERVIMDAIHPNRPAINTITSEAMKLSRIFEAAKLSVDWDKPMLPQVDADTQPLIAPSLIKLVDAYAYAYLSANVGPDDLKQIVPQEIKTAEISAAFAAHDNPFIARLLSPG